MSMKRFTLFRWEVIPCGKIVQADILSLPLKLVDVSWTYVVCFIALYRYDM